MINIVIPMAGEGSRFKKEGFSVAKPFIKFEGKTMIEHVLDGLKVDGAAYTLIIRESFRDEYKNELDLLSKKYGVNLSAVKTQTVGALATALSAYENLDPDSPVIFADSDNIFFGDTIKNFINDALARNIDASLLTFKSNSDRFSYAVLDSDAFVERTVEKEPVSEHAIAGAYLFAKVSTFLKCAIETIIYPKEKNEYYMSTAFNTLVRSGKKCGIFEIASGGFACVGTPQQLGDYLAGKNK